MRGRDRRRTAGVADDPKGPGFVPGPAMSTGPPAGLWLPRAAAPVRTEPTEEHPMSAAVICGACEETVLPDALVLDNVTLGYTWWGLRAKWTHPDLGTFHLCDPLRRELVYARDGRRVANPPWARWLWRHRVTVPLARRVTGGREFTVRVILGPAETGARP